jgi:hypothetical protein
MKSRDARACCDLHDAIPCARHTGAQTDMSSGSVGRRPESRVGASLCLATRAQYTYRELTSIGAADEWSANVRCAYSATLRQTDLTQRRATSSSALTPASDQPNDFLNATCAAW